MPVPRTNLLKKAEVFVDNKFKKLWRLRIYKDYEILDSAVD
ncbi:MAG: hypothetical protein ABIL70_02875 [candidate division WOR-3 bacterium]